MKKLSILFLALGSMAFISCNDSKNTEPEVVTVDNSPESKETYAVAEVKADFIDQNVEHLFKQYLQVENALINTDAANAATNSAKLHEIIRQTDIKVDDQILKSIISMEESDDISLQREHFETVSKWMEEILQGSLKSGSIYKQYCPMAFNNRGAYWLSTSKEVLNPYFGDKMLKCGRVDSEIISVQ